MKAITVYETNGKRFDDPQKALAYEKLCKRINGIMARLLPRTKEVEAGTDYNMHDLNILNGCFKDFCFECANVIPSFSEWFMQTITGERHLSHIGKVLSDHSHDYPILYEAYFRFSCISFENGFEFQQPYYVSHQEEFFKFIKKYGKKGGIDYGTDNI